MIKTIHSSQIANFMIKSKRKSSTHQLESYSRKYYYKHRNAYTQHKKVKDICQYLDLNTKIKIKSRDSTKHLENLKISLTFCVVYYNISHTTLACTRTTLTLSWSNNILRAARSVFIQGKKRHQ